MKSLLKVCNMNTMEDVNRVRKAIASNEGVIACEISKDKAEVQVIYDNYFVTEDKIIESIEELGYAII